MDKLGFRILMFIITGIEIIISITLYFSVNYSFLYIISVLFVSACIGGHFSILSPEFNKIFGFERGPEMYGLTGNFIGIASLCGPLMANFLLNEIEDFLKVFIIGGILCCDKFVCLLCFDENEPFKLNKKNKLNNLIDDEEKHNNDIDNNKNTDNEKESYKPIIDGRVSEN